MHVRFFIYNFYAFVLACGVGSYKASSGEGECIPCPRNSYSDKLGSTSCDCEVNFYRPFGTEIDAACVSVETSTNQTSILSNVVSKNGQNSVIRSNDPATLQVSREVVLILGAILMFILICGFIIVVFVHHKSLPKSKHQSDLDVLEHYKQGSMTPDYGHLSNGTFPAFHSDYARKSMDLSRLHLISLFSERSVDSGFVWNWSIWNGKSFPSLC